MADGYAPEPKEISLLLTIFKLYEQQKYMYDNKVISLEKRIVNISQRWIRPIVRGKLNASVEFRTKLEETPFKPIALSVFVVDLFKIQRQILCALFHLYKILRKKAVWLSLNWA